MLAAVAADTLLTRIAIGIAAVTSLETAVSSSGSRGGGGYPEISEAGLLALWHGIGPAGLAQIALSFMHDPYGFRTGWPDLPISQGVRVQFVEIKTTDRLHHSQLSTIRDFLLPLGLSVSVLQISRKSG